MKKETLHTSIFLLLLLLLADVCSAQQKAGEQPIDLTYKSTLIGGGTYTLRETYLSPEEYTGWGIRILNEQARNTSLLNGKMSVQQLSNIELSSSKNRMQTASFYHLMLDYRLGGHYHFKPIIPRLNLLAGTQANTLLGAIYNSRNGNNPVAAKAGVHLNLSGIANYSFKISRQPVSVRYQMDMPFVGAAFSPHYGQSYYEISLGNTDGLVHFASFHNHFSMKNYLTVEVPLNLTTLRVTCLNSLYQTNVNGLKTQINSTTFMIGFAREILFASPKRNKKQPADGINYRGIFD